MSYALCGFVWGLFIPYIARRFAKFMPATFAYALFDICHCRFSFAGNTSLAQFYVCFGRGGNFLCAGFEKSRF